MPAGTSSFDGLVYDLDEATYHDLPGLSSTGAKKLLRSGAHYQAYLTNPRETRDEFDIGHLVHAKVLGVGAKVTIYPDGTGPETYTHDGVELTNVLASNGALSTKAAKAFADEARSHGLVPMKRVQARVVNKMAESVLQHEQARALFEGGRPEVSMFTTDPQGVPLRGRLDYLRPKTIADLKTTAGQASEIEFARSFFRLGYHIQFGHYEHIFHSITGETLPFLWVVVETETPYLTNVFVLEEQGQDLGRALAKRARERYAEYRDKGLWGGYVNDQHRPIGTLRTPQFAIYDAIDDGTAA